MITAIDLFCGAGGLTHGLQKSGINVVAGFDIETSCEFAYSNNNDAKFIAKDVANITKQELLDLFGNSKIRLLAGCAPCQPFSTYNQGKNTKRDTKWPLMYHFSRLIEEARPELVTMENVQDVTKHKVYKDFIKSLKRLNYSVKAHKVYCPDYGIPQKRTRHVLLASRIGDVEIVPPTHTEENYVTVKDSISHLPRIQAGKSHKKDDLHKSSVLTDINIKRIKHSKPGGTWRDWPPELVAECHQKESGKTYSGVYARMSWNQPAPTMTTQCFGYGNGRFGHPRQNRAISLREAAIFQTFPENYRFTPKGDPIIMKKIGKMIGNAVPVELGNVIGQSFLSAIS